MVLVLLSLADLLTATTSAVGQPSTGHHRVAMHIQERATLLDSALHGLRGLEPQITVHAVDCNARRGR